MSTNHRDTVTQGNTGKVFAPLTDKEKWLTSHVMGSAINVHKQLGPGLLESIYEKCFCFELAKRDIPYVKQKKIELVYDGLIIDEGLKIDILIDDLIIIELKAQDVYHPVWEAQLLSYLKLTRKRVGYILNFHVPLMKDGVKRMVI